MTDSILEKTKKMVGVPADYDVFDTDIITHINTAFSTLNQLGIGPTEGFMIEDETPVWTDFIGDDPRLNNVKTYVYLRVRILFDPPSSAHHMEAVKEQIKELEWRINVYREDTAWTPPLTETPPLEL